MDNGVPVTQLRYKLALSEFGLQGRIDGSLNSDTLTCKLFAGNTLVAIAESPNIDVLYDGAASWVLNIYSNDLVDWKD